MHLGLKIACWLFLPAMCGFILFVASAAKSEKKEAMLADLLRDQDSVFVASVVVSSRPSSAQSILVGSIKSKEISAIRGATIDLGQGGQVAEFNLTQTLSSRGIPNTVASEFGFFPFPSELRTWHQKVAGIDASIELYFEPQSGRFVAFVWGGR